MGGDKAKSKRSGHYHFRKVVAMHLMAYGEEERPRPPDKSPPQANSQSVEVPNGSDVPKSCGGTHQVLSANAKSCKACLIAGRKPKDITKRKVLGGISVNYLRGKGDARVLKKNLTRTRYGCSKCQIFFCNKA